MTTLLVAANGGHLAQLVELSGRLGTRDADQLWVTFDSPQSRALLAGRRRVFIPAVEERDVVGALRGLVHAHRLFREYDVDLVISTGSGVALSFLPYAAARGIPAHYVESAARIHRPSLTGRLLQFVPGVRLYVQYPGAQGRWRYAGSVFDGFRTQQGAHEQPVRRVVVTLGSGVHGFRRVVDRLLCIMPPSIDIFWQTGSTPVDDLPIRAHRMVAADVLHRSIREADAVIAHAGCGSALAALSAGKYPILVPRDAAHRELVDDHQIELARFLGMRDLALHRAPDAITFGDVAAVARRRVERITQPPPLQLGV